MGEEIAQLEVCCTTLRTEIATVQKNVVGAESQVAQANERAAIAERAMSESKEAEIHARAALQAKSGQVTQLENSCVAFKCNWVGQMSALQQPKKLRLTCAMNKTLC